MQRTTVCLLVTEASGLLSERPAAAPKGLTTCTPIRTVVFDPETMSETFERSHQLPRAKAAQITDVRFERNSAAQRMNTHKKQPSHVHANCNPEIEEIGNA